MKAISVIGRKAGLNPAAFRAYYEESHVPLALGFYRFSGYRRSYVVAREGDLPEFAVMPEFWSVDEVANRAVAVSPNGEIIRNDEQRFMGEPRMAASAVETVLAPGPLTNRRLSIFARAKHGSVPELLNELAEWGSQIAASNVLVTLDETRPLSAGGFVADAILSLWTTELPRLKPQGDIVVAGICEFDVVETPGDLLAALAGEIA